MHAGPLPKRMQQAAGECAAHRRAAAGLMVEYVLKSELARQEAGRHLCKAVRRCGRHGARPMSRRCDGCAADDKRG
jgi:hypothetical protein